MFAWWGNSPRPGMRNRRTDFASFHRAGAQCVWRDASPTMVAAFRARFPTVPVECAAVEESDFFGRTFDGVVAWGLFFLLDADVQRRLVAKVAAVLPSGGKFLFTAPNERGSWADAMTGRTSISLGYQAYRNALEAEGMPLVGTHRDNAHNHYYFAQKTR